MLNYRTGLCRSIIKSFTAAVMENITIKLQTPMNDYVFISHTKSTRVDNALNNETAGQYLRFMYLNCIRIT